MEEIDATLLIDELKGQRNALSDQMAFMGALITKLKAEIIELKKQAPLEVQDEVNR